MSDSMLVSPVQAVDFTHQARKLLAIYYSGCVSSQIFSDPPTEVKLTIISEKVRVNNGMDFIALPHAYRNTTKHNIALELQPPPH